VWKPAAYSAPRILIFTLMLLGLVFLGLFPVYATLSNGSTNCIGMYIGIGHKLRFLPGRISVRIAKQLLDSADIMPKSPMWNQWIHLDPHMHKSSHSSVIFWYCPASSKQLIAGMCLSDNVTPVRCSTDIWNFADGAQGVDPLMVAEAAKALIESVVSPYLILLVITLGLCSFIMTMVLFLPLVFNWRHARNLHFLCITMAGASTFFLFVAILITKMGIEGGIYGVTITSLQVVTAQKGVLTEAFLWVSWVLWLFAFLLVWWVRWWEILERRELKAKAKKADDEKKKKAEEEKKAKEALKNKPLKAEEVVLQQFAAAQM
jgi:hypothetical protein